MQQALSEKVEFVEREFVQDGSSTRIILLSGESCIFEKEIEGGENFNNLKESWILAILKWSVLGRQKWHF